MANHHHWSYLLSFGRCVAGFLLFGSQIGWRSRGIQQQWRVDFRRSTPCFAYRWHRKCNPRRYLSPHARHLYQWTHLYYCRTSHRGSYQSIHQFGFSAQVCRHWFILLVDALHHLVNRTCGHHLPQSNRLCAFICHWMVHANIRRCGVYQQLEDTFLSETNKQTRG